GSRFTIFLPIGKDHFKQEDFQITPGTETLHQSIELNEELISYEEQTENKQNINTNSNNRILVVEDNEELRKYISGHLSENYHVDAVSNGKKAMRMIMKKNYQLIISDIMMPEMDGITLCHNVKTNLLTSHIPVILLTVKTSTDAKIEGYDSGADAYIVKPFSLSLLNKRILNIFESRRILKEKFRKEEDFTPAELTKSNHDQIFLEDAIGLIEQNIGNNEYKIDDFSSDLALSRSMLYRKLQELTGLSPHKFISYVRFKKAASLLKSGEYNISEVAFMVGFNDPRYFSRSFRKYYNMTPSEYIRD
ncbi:MAG: response regulator, partial [Bacteroidales bacterium]